MNLFDIVLQDKAQADIRMLIGDGWQRLRRDMALAQKFVLDRSLAATADAVMDDEVSRVLGSCRVPFGSVWIECLQADRPQFHVAPLSGSRDKLLPDRDNDFFPLAKPKRIGLLLQCPHESRLQFFAHLMWSFPNDELTPSIISMVVDLTAECGWLKELERRLDFGGIGSKDLSAHILPIPSPYYSEFLETMWGQDNQFLSSEEMRKRMPMELQRLLYEGLADWGHEPQYWFAVLALLNCRNVAASKTIDVSGLNRARTKQRRPLFAEHKILSLRLPGARAGGGTRHSSVSDEQARGHFVRGHFKVRKTGVFWWGDFFRGDPSRVVHKTYDVQYEDTK